MASLFRGIYPKGTYIPIDQKNPEKWQQVFKEALSAGCDYIYVGGGDGTINRLLPDILKTNLAVGILPVGTGNLFAKYVLGIKSPDDLLKNPEKYQTKAFYPGLSDDRPFLLMVGTGLDGNAIHSQSTRGKYWLGKVSYPIEVFFSLIRDPVSQFQIQYEDTEGLHHTKNTLWAIISRSPSYFPLFTVNPGWDPWQPALSVTLIHGSFKKDLWISLTEILMGKVPSSRITFEKAHWVRVRGFGRTQSDGEEIPVPKLVTVSKKPIFFTSRA